MPRTWFVTKHKLAQVAFVPVSLDLTICVSRRGKLYFFFCSGIRVVCDFRTLYLEGDGEIDCRSQEELIEDKPKAPPTTTRKCAATLIIIQLFHLRRPQTATAAAAAAAASPFYYTHSYRAQVINNNVHDTPIASVAAVLVQVRLLGHDANRPVSGQPGRQTGWRARRKCRPLARSDGRKPTTSKHSTTTTTT